MTDSFLNSIERRVLLADGAKGTGLLARGLPQGRSPDLWNLEQPTAIVDLHREYVAAGADVIITNSFRANRLALAEFPPYDQRILELNRAAVHHARAAAGEAVFVGGSISTTGALLRPLGSLSFDEARRVFREQAQGLEEGGVDFFHLETMGDVLEVKAAVCAIHEVSPRPVVAMMTFDETLRTLTGSPPEVVAVALGALGVDLIGANCSLGPDGILRVLAAMREVSALPFYAQPNAGLPVVTDGATVYPATPAELAGYVERYIDLGCRVIGGCCGTTPRHLQAMGAEVRRCSGPRPAGGLQERVPPLRVASRHAVVALGGGYGPALVGERINPTGRKQLTAQLERGEMDGVLTAARRQEEQGADILDINVGVPGADEEALMEAAVLAVGRATPRRPLCLDSARIGALEAGLKVAPGRPLLNSVSGETAKLAVTLELARRYGAALICLCIDDEGIPERAEGRLAIAERIVEQALASGLRREDLIVDPLTLTVAADPARSRETVRAVQLIKEHLGLPCLLGVSNVSFGLPRRQVVTAAFTAMAVHAGVDAVIANPAAATAVVDAARLLVGRDPGARIFLGRYAAAGATISAALATGEGAPPTAAPATGKSLEEALARAVIDGEAEQARRLAEQALGEGWPPLEVLGRGLVPGMHEVGRRFKSGAFFLPQVLLAAEAMQAAFSCLREVLRTTATQRRQRRVVLATVAGDVHDIGKKIVATVIESHGYEVEDLGKNVPTETIVERVRRGGVDAVGLSALMTTTMPHMTDVARTLGEEGLEVPLLVGGAVLNDAYASQIGATYCPDPMAAVSRLKALWG